MLFGLKIPSGYVVGKTRKARPIQMWEWTQGISRLTTCCGQTVQRKSDKLRQESRLLLSDRNRKILEKKKVLHFWKSPSCQYWKKNEFIWMVSAFKQ
jgi:hypothetical protein